MGSHELIALWSLVIIVAIFAVLYGVFVACGTAWISDLWHRITGRW